MISSAFGCPYEGEISTSRIVEIAKQVVAVGPAELGRGVPAMLPEAGIFPRQ